MSDSVEVSELPPCDVCSMGVESSKTKAVYDARLPGMGGSWGYVCEKHFQQYGPGRLGTGHGQRLIVKSD